MHAVKSNNGLVWWNAFMAGLSSFAGATVLAEAIDPKYAALFFAITAALQAATAAYVAGVKPVETPRAESVGLR